jgi:signal transduction histidine kinase
MAPITPMKKYSVQLGVLIATVLTFSILPVRLSEGQGADPVNLIGSQTVIWLMCMSMWLLTYHIYYTTQWAKWQKIGISLLLCAALSNFYYYNPFFEDYPLKPIRELPFWIATIRLSLRGFLVGLIMVPIIFLLEFERQRQREALQKERERALDAEQKQEMLEVLVSERTAELEQTLSVLSQSQDELDHQVYLLTRVIASIAHDVNAPLKFIISGAELTGELLGSKQLELAAECNRQMQGSLNNMALFMQNLLEFAKGQIHKGSLHMGNVNLAALVREKAGLFEQILNSRRNTLQLALDENLTVTSNANLLGVILHNLLDNATKYTYDGVIEISTALEDNQLHLSIQNPVSGEPGSKSMQTNQPHLSERNLAGNGQGLGLILVKDISALLNVNFLMETAAGKVTARIRFDVADQQKK